MNRLFSAQITALNTNTPFLADKLNSLSYYYFNQALTYMGVSNIDLNKKERAVTDEVQSNMGGVSIMAQSALDSRRQAVEKINKMFGLSVEVSFNDEYIRKLKDDINEYNITDIGDLNE